MPITLSSQLKFEHRITDEAYKVFFDAIEAQARSLARTLLVRLF